MITKNELYCLKLILKGPFFEEYLCCINIKGNKKFLNTRVMRKTAVMKNIVDEKMIEFELMIRSNLRHNFLVNQVCAFQDYDNLFYVTESAPICLFDNTIFPNTFTLMQSRFYISEIFLCLKHLHSKGQNYTFISPNNVLVGVDGHIKLDYGFCNSLEINGTGIAQNIEYTSLDYVCYKKFSFLSDYWSMGILLYKMIHGYTPFHDDTAEKIIKKMIDGDIVFSKGIDNILEDFIRMLLDENNFGSNITCEEFDKKIEEHPFFCDIDWNKVEQKKVHSPFYIKSPLYDLANFPKLSRLYTSDFHFGTKDGYGKSFNYYNTVHFLVKK